MLTIKIGSNQRDMRNKKVEEAVTALASLKEAEKELKNRMREQQTILSEFGAVELEDKEEASINLIAGDDKVTISYGFTITVKDIDKLKHLLGDRYTDLVSEEVVATPEKNLKKEIKEDLQAKGTKFIECIQVKEKAPAFKVA